VVGDKQNVGVVDELITKHLPLDPHMSGDVIAWYLKECLLEAKQILVCVGNPPKKLIIGDKTKPLSSQKVKLKNEQPRVKGL